jgi:hypothetical protein
LINLDQKTLAVWCRSALGSAPERVRFRLGHLSDVIGLRLLDGRDVVVKARRWEDRLVACAAVQQSLRAAGYPAPEVLAGPDRVAGLALNAEEMDEGGDRQIDMTDATPFAVALAWLISAAPAAASLSTLRPSPPWMGWDHAGAATWPAPDDVPGSLNAFDTDWVDECGLRTRRLLRDFQDSPVTLTVVGHGDWWSDNLRWRGSRLHVVHDWDSVAAQPEVALVGLAAAIWAADGEGGYSSIEQTEAFLAAYAIARRRQWADTETRVAWAAGLWSRAFDAKKAAAIGRSPESLLPRVEAEERLARSGL